MSEKIPKETFEEILERRPTNRVFFTCMVAQKKGKFTKETNKKNLIKYQCCPVVESDYVFTNQYHLKKKHGNGLLLLTMPHNLHSFVFILS